MVDLSLVIPTFNEAHNLPVLLARIFDALRECSLKYEIWFIDDSTDSTPILLDELSKQHPCVHFIHRTTQRGLGSAVVDGFKKARGQWLIVMDADLQHPPETLPQVLSALQSGSDIVIPSRFIQGGSDGGLNIFRKAVSLTARTLGQWLIREFRSVTDCTSGYFGLHRRVIEGITLTPQSWKILMEILVKGHYQSLQEIPYPFAARDADESKMTLLEQWKFLLHLLALRKHQKNQIKQYLA